MSGDGSSPKLSSTDTSKDEPLDSRAHASETAAALLEHMQSRELEKSKSGSQTRGPGKSAPREQILLGGSCSKEELEEVRKEITTQDQIISALQKDNEALRTSTRQFEAHTKMLKSKLANLEAKYSLLQSATESVSAVDQSVEVRKLSERNRELQQRLEQAEMHTLSAKAEAGQLLTEVAKVASLEADLRAARMMQGQSDLKYRAEIAALTAKIAELTSTQRVGNKDAAPVNANTSVASIEHVEIQQVRDSNNTKEIEKLQARISELQEALQHQQKNNVKELIATMQPHEDPRRVSRLEARVQQLGDALNEKDVAMEQMVERLRSETNSLRSGYEDRIRRLEAQLRQSQHELRRAQTAGQSSSPPALREKRDTAVNMSRDSVGDVPEKQVHFAADSAERENPFLRDRVNALASELEEYKQLAAESHALLQRSNEAWENQSSALKEDFLQQLRCMRQKHNEDIDRLQQHHKGEMTCVLEELRGLKKESISWEPPQLTDEACSTQENERAFLESVVKRLAYLERHCIQREKEAAFEVAEAKRVALAEHRLQRERYEMLLSHKNQQIHQFRMELDDMIGSIACLRHSPHF